MKKSSKKNLFDEFIINLKNQDKALLFCTIALTIWGLFNIVTASSRESVTHFDQSLYYYFFRHLVMISIGFAISLCIINISSKKHYFLSTLGYVGIIIGHKSNKNRMGRSITIGIILYFVFQGATLGLIAVYGLFNPDVMNLLNTTDIVNVEAIKSVMYAGIGIYVVYSLILYCLGRRYLKKGVNIE